MYPLVPRLFGLLSEGVVGPLRTVGNAVSDLQGRNPFERDCRGWRGVGGVRLRRRTRRDIVISVTVNYSTKTLPNERGVSTYTRSSLPLYRDNKWWDRTYVPGTESLLRPINKW